MEIRIRNFGPIQSFDFDLNKDLHLIYGQNNIGKSYAISAVYATLINLFKSTNEVLTFLMLEDFFSQENSRNVYADIVALVKQKIEQKNFRQMAITSQLKLIFRNIVSDLFLPGFEQTFRNSFSDLATIQNRWVKEDFSITILGKWVVFRVRLNRQGHFFIDDFELTVHCYLRFLEINRMAMLNTLDQKLFFYASKNNFDEHAFAEELKLMIVLFASSLFCEIGLKFDGIYFLPASRSGLYQGMNSLNAIFAQISQWRGAVDKKIEIPTLPTQVSDYYLNLVTINNNYQQNLYSQIAADMEKNILRLRFYLIRIQKEWSILIRKPT